ncbi:predicted protein [Postia placenta Mad-698-R]|nr:predicted protein [Postia placenta Mad-698-R]
MPLDAAVNYIAASTNRHPQAGDASSRSLVAFGSSKLIALWDAKWRTTSSTRAHDKSVSAMAVLEDVIVTAASDSSVKIWKIVHKEQSVFYIHIGHTIYQDVLLEQQTISLRGRYTLSLSLSPLPGAQGVFFACISRYTATILAIGGTDKNVQIWTRSDAQFVSSAILSGHEDWVRSLAFRQPEKDSDPLILASGSQDATIRLWNIESFISKSTNRTDGESSTEVSDELLDAFEASLAEVAVGEEGGRQISLKRHILTVKGSQNSTQQFSITFDALLVGHEASVTSLAWRPLPPSSSSSAAAFDRTPTLLSTSTDSSLILWSPSTILTSTSAQENGQDGTTSLWINRQRFGDVGGQRLGGFVGGLWTRGGAEAGHNGPVRGISWSPDGEYLLSASQDQTTRIHAAIPTTSGDQSAIPIWHEIGRPQVHGYDLINVATLGPLRFVSIADEKVARVFEAPREFVDIVNNLKIAHLAGEGERPRAATVLPLGLSNKAVSEGTVLRLEGELAAFTLWPEVEKIFGHGYESITLTVSRAKRFMATACKATTADHAVVRIYDTEKWQPVGKPLAGHTLTVTRVAFSPDDRFVLSVSRDRSWRLYEYKEDNGYIPVAADRTHARIIWDCAWAPEGVAFATASRDKTVKVWQPKVADNFEQWAAVATLKTVEAATALTFAPKSTDGRSTLAIGLENGAILIYSCPQDNWVDWRLDLTIDSSTAHVDHIHRLECRPCTNDAGMQLASCSEDNTLKILTVRTVQSGSETKHST